MSYSVSSISIKDITGSYYFYSKEDYHKLECKTEGDIIEIDFTDEKGGHIISFFKRNVVICDFDFIKEEN